MAKPGSSLDFDPSAPLFVDTGSIYNGESVTVSSAKSYFGLSDKKRRTVVILSFANFLLNVIISFQAPFYPKEAESKGAVATEYGLVLGSFQLVVFIMSPIYGYIIRIANPKLVYTVGMFTVGICAVLFGFLHYIDDHITFITLSFVFRITQACGHAAFLTSSFTIVAIEFQDAVATTFATLETCSGLGLIIGSVIGSALYEVGGFPLPFLTMGSLFAITAILCHFFLPPVGSPQDESGIESNIEKSSGGIIALLKSPAVSLSIFSVIISASSIGFLVATIEPHLRGSFGLEPSITSIVFVLDSVVYAISAPFWGRLCDKCREPKLMTLFGCLVTFTGFLFIGPAPFMPFETTLWVTCLGLVIHGLGLAATIVSAFAQALQDAILNGFPDTVRTYGLVSGVWASGFALGNFIGPSVGGVLLDNFGFRLGSLYVLVSQLVVAFLVVLYLCLTKSRKFKPKSRNTESECDSLLRHENAGFSGNVGYDALTN